VIFTELQTKGSPNLRVNGRGQTDTISEGT